MKIRYLAVLAAIVAALFLFGACGDDDDGEEVSGYPSAGEDNFESTTATVQIEISAEGASAGSINLHNRIRPRFPQYIADHMAVSGR